MDESRSVVRLLKAVATIGNRDADTEREQLQHGFLVYMGLFMSCGGLVWGGLALYYNAPLPSLIPFGYSVLTALNFTYFYYSKNFKLVRFVQVSLSLMLPFMFQWVLGGFATTGAVMLWSMLALVGSLTFQDAGLSVRWLATYLLLTVVSGLVDGRLQELGLGSSLGPNTLLFVLNISIISTIVFGLTVYLIGQQEEQNRSLENALRQLRETQNQLVMQEKMASLGSLVAGVVHEMNTPLGAITSMHDTMDRAISKLDETLKGSGQFAGDVKVQKTFKVMEDANRVVKTGTHRVSDIVRSLKTFARLDEAGEQVFDIHEGIDSSIMLLSPQIGDRITVTRSFSEVSRVHGSPGQLNQVFLSLLKNAVQSIDGEGSVEVSTRARGATVEINIRDTGCGIPGARLERIFDFGFNAADTRVKMGFGLPTAYRTVQDHGGSIEIRSDVGQGTTVTMVLPATDLPE